MAAEGAKAIRELIATPSNVVITTVMSAAGESRARSAGEMAAAHVSATHRARSAECTGMAAATLGAEGYGEEKCERRDGNQRAHTQPL